MLWRLRRQIRMILHGDDYVSAGFNKDLKWLNKKLEEGFGFETRLNYMSNHLPQFYNQSATLRNKKVLPRWMCVFDWNVQSARQRRVDTKKNAGKDGHKLCKS